MEYAVALLFPSLHPSLFLSFCISQFYTIRTKPYVLQYRMLLYRKYK